MTASPSLPKPLTAGSEIDAWCTRCKLDLGHRIVAMVHSTPKRVLCQTCGSEHNYRPPKSAKQAKATTRKPRAGATSKSTGQKPRAKSAASYGDWEAAVRSGKPFRDYSIDKHFEEGELLRHKKFGEGYVVAQLGPQKISVAFSSGEKTLIHDHSA